MRVIVPALLVLVFVLNSVVCADQPVPAVPETQGLVTTTTADVVGMATETDAGAWTLTNNSMVFHVASSVSGVILPYGPSTPAFMTDFLESAAQLNALGGSIAWHIDPGTGNVAVDSISVPESAMNVQANGYYWPQTWGMVYEYLLTAPGFSASDVYPGIHTGVLHPGQVQYTTAYDANIVAQAGHTVLSKSMNINTGNKVLTQSNLNAKTLLTFVATGDGGNVVGSENLMLDGAGSVTTASDRMLCPFAATPIDQIPSYCNIVQTGSAYELTVGSITSDMSERFVGTDATIPVQLDHAFNVKPYGTTDGSIPAIGSASAYFKAHIQEARVNGTQKAEDLQYSESSSASGVIRQFTKEMKYQSGKSLLP